jgi:hypothetical protein
MFIIETASETFSRKEKVFVNGETKRLNCLYIVAVKPAKKHAVKKASGGELKEVYVYTVEKKKDKRGAPLYILNPAKTDDFILNLKYNVTKKVIEGHYSFNVRERGMLGGEYNVEYNIEEKPNVEKYRQFVVNSTPNDIAMSLNEELDLKDCKIRVHYSKFQGVNNPGIRNIEIKCFRRKTGKRVLVNDWWNGPSRTHDFQYMADLYSDFTEYETAPDEVKNYVKELVELWKEEAEKSKFLHKISTEKNNVRITYYKEMN